MYKCINVFSFRGTRVKVIILAIVMTNRGVCVCHRCLETLVLQSEEDPWTLEAWLTPTDHLNSIVLQASAGKRVCSDSVRPVC